MQSGDGLVGAGVSGVSLGNGVSRGAIAVGVSGDEGTIAVCSVKEGGVGISRPLAETLGRPGNEGGGGSGVTSDSGKTVSVSVGVSSIGSVGVGTVSVSSVQKGGVGLSLGISRPLAVQVQVSRGGGGGDLSGEAIGGTETIGIGVSSIGVGESVSVSSVQEGGISLSLGVSGPLAIGVSGSASVAGGLAVGGAHSRPVGVGVEEGRGVAQVSSLSISRDGDSSASNNLREEKEVRSRSLEASLWDHIPTIWTSF